MPSRFEKLEIEPERVQVMKTAFYKACAELGLSPTPDRLTDILVTKIIDLCMAGERDPDRLSEIVVAYFQAAERKGPGTVESPAKYKEYAEACREMVPRMPDPSAKQKLLDLVEAWEELARQARNYNRG
jgi:hypothetical protein